MAHDNLYLVKNLLAGMPQVTERVAQMRQGRAPRNQADNQARNLQSQVQSTTAGHHWQRRWLRSCPALIRLS